MSLFQKTVLRRIITTFAFLSLFVFSLFSDSLEENFSNPPSQTRILKIVHSLPDKPESQEFLFNKLKNEGFGGIVCNISFDQYLKSEEKWGTFISGVEKAKKNGFWMWLYDERGYPSGNAGGLVLKEHSEWEARGLLILSTNINGFKHIKLHIPDGNLVLAKAFPVSNEVCITRQQIDLKTFIKNGVLEWTAPEGSFQIAVVTEHRLYEGTHADMNLWEKIPYINLLKPEPTEMFLKLTHAEYAKRLGNNLGKYFESTFTDEPSLMSLFLKPMPWKVLPWSDNLPVEFQNRRGYDIEKNLVSLFLETDNNWKRHRYDFWLTIGELVSENYFCQIRDWCRKHNILSGGHLLAEEGIVNHVPLYGDFFRCIRMLDSPGIDCLTSVPDEVPWYIARLVASAGWLDGKNVIMCEASDHSQVYRPQGDKRTRRIVTEEEIRGTLNRLFVNGVTRITSYYSFEQLTDEQLKRLNLQCGRCVWLIENSKPEPDIGVLYPIQSLWTKFVPSELWSREATSAAKIEKTYRTVINVLFAEKQEFMIVDYETLEKCKIDRGYIRYGNLKLNTIVLPSVDTLSWKALENLDRFVKSGGNLLVVGSLPQNTEKEFPSKKAKSLVKTWLNKQTDKPGFKKHGDGSVCYLPQGFEFMLGEIIESVNPGYILLNDPYSQLKIGRRRINNKTLFFIINDSNQKWTGNLIFSNYFNGEIWNPISGEIIKNIPSIISNFLLEPYGMVFFCYDKKSQGKKDISPSQTKILFEKQTINCSTPKIVKGEFVDARLENTNSEINLTNKIYSCESRITKSNVDTWSFLVFPIKDAKGLDSRTTISFNLQIPQFQKVKNQVLLIVKENGGGDFIGETGVYLNECGERPVRVSLKTLQLAGWSKDEDGVLDPQKIEEIRIGWGGYHGREGERIVFKTDSPKAEKVILSGK